jgi:hypothetical protein
VPPGALVSFVQKGLQYVEIEAHLNEVLLSDDDDGGGFLFFNHSMVQ